MKTNLTELKSIPFHLESCLCSSLFPMFIRFSREVKPCAQSVFPQT